jgi:hypothetical protein
MKSLILYFGIGSGFLGMWFYIAYRVAAGGWVTVVPKCRATGVPSGMKIGCVSGWFSRSSYSSTLSVWIAKDGVFLRPILLLRSFHPLLLIPWGYVVSMEEEQELLSKWTLIEFDIDGISVILKLPGHRKAGCDRFIINLTPNSAPESTPTSPGGSS